MPSPSRLAALRSHFQVPLYRNAYALIVNTGLTSALGALYWIVAARAFDSKEVGKATALVSTMMLLSAITQANFTSVLIRFLPRAGGATKRLISGSYLIAGSIAVVGTVLVLGVAAFVAPDGNVLNMSVPMACGFVVSTVIWSIFSLQDSVLTGLRRSMVVPIENAVYGAAKIIALLMIASGMDDAKGIFASWTIPTFAALLPINWLIYRRYAPEHQRRTQPDEQPLDRKRIAKFIAGDYAAGLFAQASSTLLPVIIFGIAGSKATAYFYMAQTIGTALDRTSLSLSSALTVEAASDEAKMAEYTRSMVRRGLVLVGCLAAVVIVGAPFILSIFGGEYADHATGLLRLLALASVPRVFSVVYGSVARMQHKTHHIAMITFTQATILIGGTFLLVPWMGLVGTGVAALLSQALIVSFVAPALVRAMRGGHGAATAG